MHWLHNLLFPVAGSPIGTAHTLLVLSIIIAIGVMVGSIRVFGISLGVAGVLFAGLVCRYFGLTGELPVLDFAQGIGLVLFVYTIGIQVGPGFLASLKAQGLRLNLLTAAIVLLGVAGTVVIGRLILPHKEFPAVVGVFCGATTSTPSLAATQQAVASKLPNDLAAQNQPVLGYAVAYPFGVIGIILSMFVVRWIFRVNLKKEGDEILAQRERTTKKLDTLNVQVENPNLDGMTVADVLSMLSSEVIVSRVYHGDETKIAMNDTPVSQGDVLLAVAPPDALDAFRRLVGSESKIDLKEVPSQIEIRQILVTQQAVIGKSIPDLSLTTRYEVTATRIFRGDVELPATASVPLQFGDRILAVGPAERLNAVSAEFGDSTKQRDKPMIVPLFIGVLLGVIVGSVPVQLPGFPSPVTLGLAGGPLITAIVLSRIGKIGNLVWYMPRAANLMLREIGIVLFLACVGLKAGGEFVPALTSGHGFLWMGYGALITVIPLLGVALIARGFFKLNYMPLCGLMAGSMTDTAALAFATQATGSDEPSIAYATVYPMAVLLRVLAVQAMILFFR